ncbi:MAG: pro-sigmaK processing inhibitor BofA family protein [Bacillota bacterium]|nr:pro-sigmaK processing inhibitor BofA family protein [Bacillota bacterium]
MPVNYGVIAAYAVGIILLFILGRIFVFPMKFILKLLYNALIGGIVLIVINLLGGLVHYHIALNVVSALIVGTLGVPGIIFLVVLKLIFKL